MSFLSYPTPWYLAAHANARHRRDGRIAKAGFSVPTLDGTFVLSNDSADPTLPLLIVAYDSQDAASRCAPLIMSWGRQIRSSQLRSRCRSAQVLILHCSSCV